MDSNWPPTFDYSYKISKTGGSGSCKGNSLFILIR